jgi:hypothetical protein
VPASPVATPGATTPATPPARSPLPDIPAPPAAPTIVADNLTAANIAELQRMAQSRTVSADEMRKAKQTMQTQNAAAARSAYDDQMGYARELRERASSAELSEQRRVDLLFKADEAQRKAEQAKRETEQHALTMRTQGVPTGYQRTESGAIEPIPGYQGATPEERNDYTLRHSSPDSQDYADAWAAKKWKMSPTGLIENDMSGYPAPTRSIQRPSYLPQPTGEMLNEVRKADTDAKVIVPTIDHYVDVFKETGGQNWGAYFDNTADPKSQKLLGAFDRLKTVLRSPTYYNTGVLQPAEMELLKQDLVSPKTIRGVWATPQALEARLHEIKLAVLTRQDAELRSIGKPGVIVRDKGDLTNIPDGGRFYDEDGNLRIKPRAE